MPVINDLVEVGLCTAFGLVVAGAFWLFCMWFNILSPSKRVADSRARFDVPKAEEFDADRWFHGDGPSLGRDASDVYKHESERARFAAGPALETCVRLMRSGDVAETDSTHVSCDFLGHERIMDCETEERQGQ